MGRTQDIEERIKKETQEELNTLRNKANKVDELIIEQKEELQTATHKVKLEMAEKLSKDYETLFSQIEDLKNHKLLVKMKNA
jgi:flavodoxin